MEKIVNLSYYIFLHHFVVYDIISCHIKLNHIISLSYHALNGHTIGHAQCTSVCTQNCCSLCPYVARTIMNYSHTMIMLSDMVPNYNISVRNLIVRATRQHPDHLSISTFFEKNQVYLISNLFLLQLFAIINSLENLENFL